MELLHIVLQRVHSVQFLTMNTRIKIYRSFQDPKSNGKCNILTLESLMLFFSLIKWNHTLPLVALKRGKAEIKSFREFKSVPS